MSFLLMVFLTLVCLFEFNPPDRDTWFWGLGVARSAELTALAVGLVALHALAASRRVLRALARDPDRREAILRRYERARSAQQWLLLGAFVLALAAFGWGWAVRQFWRSGEQPLPGLD